MIGEPRHIYVAGRCIIGCIVGMNEWATGGTLKYIRRFEEQARIGYLFLHVCMEPVYAIRKRPWFLWKSYSANIYIVLEQG
jgi:hypothetical protein